jgi:hypothetical protein
MNDLIERLHEAIAYDHLPPTHQLLVDCLAEIKRLRRNVRITERALEDATLIDFHLRRAAEVEEVMDCEHNAEAGGGK